MSYRFQSWLREDLPYRRASFSKGLIAAGFKEAEAIAEPLPGDIFLCWNRHQRLDREARRFEAAGARVLVAENGYLGKNWLGRTWFALAIGHHAGAGIWPQGDAKRWDSWAVALAPWRGQIGETVLLAQRSIGEPGIASPEQWAEQRQKELRGRIRPHPGKERDSMELEHDLRNAANVLTWASSAALHALRIGVPVFHEYPRWIGAAAALPLYAYGFREPLRSDAARLAMFRRLAWAMWTLDEIESGAAFAWLKN